MSINLEKPSTKESEKQWNHQDNYLSFEVTFGPMFPITAGSDYAKLYSVICAEIPKCEPGSISHAFLHRTKQAMELAAQEDPQSYWSRIFNGSLWCHQGGCGSCTTRDGKNGKSTNCQTLGQHCESSAAC